MTSIYAQNSNLNQNMDVISIDLVGRPLSTIIKEVEAAYFSHILTETGGNKTHAAERAGMTLETFRRKIRAYSIRTVFHIE